MNSEKVAEKILSRILEEEKNNILQCAKGCIAAINMDGKEKIMWLINSPIKKNFGTTTNILGDITTVNYGPNSFLKVNGETVFSKNSPFGNVIAESGNSLGIISYKVDNKAITQDVVVNSVYNVNRAKFDAYDGNISTKEDDGLQFENASLTEALQKLKELNDLVKDARKKGRSEDEQLTLKQQIKRLEEEIEKKRSQSRRRRRTTNSLKEQFLMSPEQNKVKRSKLFNGPLLINGGPGTGKTTLLIQRIQYMLDLEEVVKDELLTTTLTVEERVHIQDPKRSWIFFSPTKLLKKYLEGAMAIEGMRAHDETVRTWAQHRSELKMSLGLFNAEKNRPFQAYNKEPILWDLSPDNIVKIEQAFDKYLKEFFQKKILRITSLKINEFEWQPEATQINNTLNEQIRNFKIENLINSINAISSRYSTLRSGIERDYRELISELSNKVQSRLSDDEKVWIRDVLKEKRKRNTSATFPDNEVEKTEENINDDEEEEQEEMEDAFEDEEVIDGKRLEIDINKTLKRLIRNNALSKVDQNTKLSNADRTLKEKISKHTDIFEDKYELVGSYSLFLKYYKPLLKGPDNYILSQFSRIYKSFRKSIIPGLDWLPSEVKQRLVKIIGVKPHNTKIHDDELDLLIYLNLRLSRIFFNTNATVFNRSNHPSLQAYNSYMRALVAVDEATDFTPLQLACMYMLSRPRLNSLTISGDLMQQMNERGVSNWNDLSVILPNIETHTLLKSYRQTPKLLKLASILFKKRYGNEPGFFSALEDDNENDPDPLFLIDSNFNNKIRWISARIEEVYKIYERVIPNIAVFVKDDLEIKSFTNALNESEVFQNNNIKAEACIGEGEIGSASFVRVFNINLIKGMEFETVFFIDVDEYSEDNTKILDKLIYVGISRATYYLAVMFKAKIPEKLEPIKHLLVDGNWDFENYSDY